MKIWEAINAGNTEELARMAAASDKAIIKRIRTLHDAKYTCSTWETWTETNVPCDFGNGKVERGDVTYDGCREHYVSLART